MRALSSTDHKADPGFSRWTLFRLLLNNPAKDARLFCVTVQVQHFSKYGLSDSDEEGPVNTIAAATKPGVVPVSDVKKLKVGGALPPKALVQRGREVQ